MPIWRKTRKLFEKLKRTQKYKCTRMRARARANACIHIIQAIVIFGIMMSCGLFIKETKLIKFFKRSNFSRSLEKIGIGEIYKEGNAHLYSVDNCVMITWLFKTRAELIYLNKYNFSISQKICPLCNKTEEKDVMHFIAVCTILKDLRSGCMHVNRLSGRK